MKFSTATLFLAGIPLGTAFFQVNSSPKDARPPRPTTTTLSSSVSAATSAGDIKEDPRALMTNDAEDLAWSIGNWEMLHTPQLGSTRTNAFTTSTTSYQTMKDALQLIQQAARRMSHGRRDIQDDLVQEGVVALMHAIHHYPTLTHHTESFQQYAKRYILLEMTANAPFSSSSTSSTKQPSQRRMDSVLQSAQRRIQQQQQLQKKKMVSVESTIETNDPDEVTKVFIDQDYFDKMHSTATITTDRTTSSSITTTTPMDKMWEEEDEEQVWMQPAASLKELIVDRDELSPEADVLQTMLRSDVHDFLADMLNDVEHQVVSLHYGLHGKALSLRDTAKRMKTTKEFVRSIQEQAIAKLRGGTAHANQKMEPYVEGRRSSISSRSITTRRVSSIRSDVN